EELSEEKYGIVVKLDNTELMDKINASLAKLKEDGTYEAIHKMHFAPSEE
ncbi:MAG: transporter substrate-binding domain-containing protein, partial [Clostridiales bacterium]|nr:transporter substrate-binding domain-containing protein [Clostridiales bacterium]